MTQRSKSYSLRDLHVLAVIGERGEAAWAAARALDDALYDLAGREAPNRVITVNDQTGLISIDTPTGEHDHPIWDGQR